MEKGNGKGWHWAYHGGHALLAVQELARLRPGDEAEVGREVLEEVRADALLLHVARKQPAPGMVLVEPLTIDREVEEALEKIDDVRIDPEQLQGNKLPQRLLPVLQARAGRQTS